jgi:hypothetical protein
MYGYAPALGRSMPMPSPMPSRPYLWVRGYVWPSAIPIAPIGISGSRGYPGVDPGGGGGYIYIGPSHEFFAQNDLVLYMQISGGLDHGR